MSGRRHQHPEAFQAELEQRRAVGLEGRLGWHDWDYVGIAKAELPMTLDRRVEAVLLEILMQPLARSPTAQGRKPMTVTFRASSHGDLKASMTCTA